MPKGLGTFTPVSAKAVLAVSVILLVALVFRGHSENAPPAQPADIILLHGKIITVDPHDSVVQALAIRDGKILAVGSDAEIAKLKGSATRTIDLHGRTATPGLIDAHCHFDETSALYDIDLNGVKRVAEVVELVRKKVAQQKPGEWILGVGWDESKLAELRYLRSSDLDNVSPQNPVWLTHTTGHYGVANAYALRLAKITATTKDPPVGTIDRDANGDPSGVLKEAAMDLVVNLIPPATKEQQRNGILKMMADFNKEGMTAAKDPGIDPDRWQLYRELLGEDKFTVRIFALMNGGRTVESAQAAIAFLQQEKKPPQSYGDGTLLAGGIKLYMDGSGGGRTAWVYDPWFIRAKKLDAGNTGYPNIEPAEYRRMVKAIHGAGIHVSTHAVGDRAIDWVVDSYAEALKEKPTKGLRHGIIHCNIPTDHAIDTIATLQREYDAGYPEAQAPFLWWIGDTYAGTFGPQRGLRLEPFHTYVEKHIEWAGGSDFPVTPYPARYGLWASVVRKTANGIYGSQPFGTAESVDIHTALKSYTIWAAHALFLEERTGSLEPGKDADIAIWDQDLYAIPPDQLKDLRCKLTLLRGKVVFEAK
jgi:predicted amidohydrolase YtcJ